MLFMLSHCSKIVCFVAAMKELLKQESDQRVYNGLQGY